MSTQLRPLARLNADKDHFATLHTHGPTLFPAQGARYEDILPALHTTDRPRLDLLLDKKHKFTPLPLETWRELAECQDYSWHSCSADIRARARQEQLLHDVVVALGGACEDPKEKEKWDGYQRWNVLLPVRAGKGPPDVGLCWEALGKHTGWCAALAGEFGEREARMGVAGGLLGGKGENEVVEKEEGDEAWAVNEGFEGEERNVKRVEREQEQVARREERGEEGGA